MKTYRWPWACLRLKGSNVPSVLVTEAVRRPRRPPLQFMAVRKLPSWPTPLKAVSGSGRAIFLQRRGVWEACLSPPRSCGNTRNLRSTRGGEAAAGGASSWEDAAPPPEGGRGLQCPRPHNSAPRLPCPARLPAGLLRPRARLWGERRPQTAAASAVTVRSPHGPRVAPVRAQRRRRGPFKWRRGRAPKFAQVVERGWRPRGAACPARPWGPPAVRSPPLRPVPPPWTTSPPSPARAAASCAAPPAACGGPCPAASARSASRTAGAAGHRAPPSRCQVPAGKGRGERQGQRPVRGLPGRRGGFLSPSEPPWRGASSGGSESVQEGEKVPSPAGSGPRLPRRALAGRLAEPWQETYNEQLPSAPGAAPGQLWAVAEGGGGGGRRRRGGRGMAGTWTPACPAGAPALLPAPAWAEAAPRRGCTRRRV